MKRLKAIFGIAVFIVLLGLAGRSDRNDAVVVEMKDNGAYWELAEQYPQADDVELVRIYEEQRNDIK